MKRNKYLIILICTVVLGIAAGSGLLVWRNKERVNDHRTTTSKKRSTDSAFQDLSGNESVSLNQPKHPKRSGGLSVDQNTQAASLGQLWADSNQQGEGSGGSTTKKSSPFDPSTFAQYDKYVNESNGLFGEVIVGNGPELTAGKKAAVYYKGWLTNGQLFDQSQADDEGQLQPFVFTMGARQVIPGWEQALAGMKVGGVRLVIVPPAVGYGASGQGPIPGNAVLVFQVQLVAVE